MKLTPLDIHHKEFHRAIRGYHEEEVDRFLDEIAEEFERLFKENIELKEQLEKMKGDLENYATMEKALQNALLTAQKSAEDVTGHAQKEAELIVRDAELKGKEIIQEAYDLKRKYESSLIHLKEAEEEFRTKFKSMLESYIRIADSTAALADITSNLPEFNNQPSEVEKLITERLESEISGQSPASVGSGGEVAKPESATREELRPNSNEKHFNGKPHNGKHKNSVVINNKKDRSNEQAKVEVDSLVL